MVKGDFGVRLLYNKDILLTANGTLVHFAEERSGYNVGRSSEKIYFYIKDDGVCAERNDDNYVIDVVELSNIPIYHGNNPKFSLYGNDYERERLINESKVCLYYYSDDYKLKFFIRFIYNDKTYVDEISEKSLSLLKYIWFTTQNLTFEKMEELGEEIYEQVSSTNTYKIINELKIIYSEREYSIRDNDYTSFIERWLICTEDFYILYKLLEIEENLCPRPSNDYVRHMYGPGADDKYTIFNKNHVFAVAKYNFLKRLINKYKTGDDIKDLIKYYILEYGLFNQVYSGCLASKFDFKKPDIERFEEAKTKSIVSEFITSYDYGKHIAGLYYALLESIKVPSTVMRDVIAGYKKWLVEEIDNSGLSHLCLYWPSKEICEEFNKCSNARFNFRFDFSLFDKVLDED